MDDRRSTSERDGAVCVRGAVVAPSTSSSPGRRSTPTWPTSRRAPSGPATDDDGAFVEDFCNWQRLPAMRAVHRGVRRRRHRRRADGLARRCGCTTTTSSSRSPAPASARRGTRTSRTTTSTAARTSACGSRSIRCRGRRRWSSSPGRTAASGSCRARSSTTRRKWFPDGSLAELPDIDAGPTTSASSAGRSSPATPCSSTCSRCTPPAACPARTAGGCCRCASSATTPSHAPRPWATSPPFPGLADELPAGAPMDHPLFPVLWHVPGRPA